MSFSGYSLLQRDAYRISRGSIQNVGGPSNPLEVFLMCASLGIGSTASVSRTALSLQGACCGSCKQELELICQPEYIGVGRCRNDSCPLTLQLRKKCCKMPDLRCISCGSGNFCYANRSIPGASRPDCENCPATLQIPQGVPGKMINPRKRIAW